MFCHLKAIILIPSFLSSLIHHFFCVSALFLMDGPAQPKQSKTKTYSIIIHLFASFSNFTFFVMFSFSFFSFKDACGTRNGTFSIRVESVPCCDEALTCSRSVIFDLQVNVSFCDTLTSCFVFLLLYFMCMRFGISFIISTKGHCHADTERHEGDQKEPRWLDVGERLSLFNPLCRTLHHNLSTEQRDNTHLGQTHTDHCRAAATLEGEQGRLFMYLRDINDQTPFTIHFFSFISQLVFQNHVCGLCGNFDASEMNDLQLSDSASKSLNCPTYIQFFLNDNKSVDEKTFTAVSSPVTFGNSWKAKTPPCTDVTTEMFPCERSSYCSVWAQRRCMILTGDTFRHCHLLVCLIH